MGKTLTDEDIKLNIIVNGNQAQKQLFDLEKSTRKLTEENKQLSLQKKLLEKQGKQETDQYKLITETMKANTAEIKNNKAAMSQLQKEIGITGLTMDQLAKKAVELKMKLRHAIPGSEAHQRYTNELGQVNGRLDELNGRARTAQFSVGGLADKFNRYAALGATVLAGLTGFVVSIQKIIDLNGKLSDAQTNVMKTTGMTKEQVDELTKSFGLLKTRTGRIELLGIAEVGGRLGIAKNEIQDFVRVMDKSAVALGDSFEGGPDVVAEKLGRIKGLYEELKDVGVEQAFESVGSAMNDLGADGTASESNIAEFMTRVGALPSVLKPSAKEAAGLGAAFEESGLKAEIAASNYGKVISIASRDFDKFAKIMQRPKKEIENLLNTNPTEFFLQFSQSLKNLDATELSKVLDYLKLNDNEVKMVLGAASQNTDLFRQKIDLAGKSMEDATSLTNEYNLKNSNLAATLDKLKKAVVGWFSSETFVAWLESAVNWLAELVGAIDTSDSKTNVWKNTLVFTAKIIAVVTAAIITNVAWQKLVALWTTRNTEATILYNIASRARAIADGIAIVATQAYAAATMLMTGNVRGATQAVRVMAAAMKTTPWGLILGMLTAAAAAYVVFSERAEKLTKVQKVLADVNLEASKSIAKEKAELELLSKIAKDETISKEKRQKAIEKLNEIIPDYIGNLSLENIKTSEGISILKKYTDELYKNAKAKAAAAKFEELARQRLDVEAKTSKDYRGTSDKVSDSIFSSLGIKTNYFKDKKEIEQYVLKNFGDAIGKRKDETTGVTMVDSEKYRTLVEKLYKASGLNSKEKELADIDAQMKALESLVFENSMSLEKPADAAIVPDANADLADDGKDKKGKEKKYDDSYLDQERKLREELYQVWKKSEEDRIGLMKDGYDKELALENLKHQDLIRQNFLANEAVVDLQKELDAQMEEAVKNGDTKKIASLKNMQAILTDKKKELSKSLEYEESMHALRIGIIQEKSGKNEIELLKEKYDQEKTVRETAFLEELNASNLTEEEKRKRREEFDKKELDYLEKSLQDQLAVYKQAMSEQSFNGVAFDLLTPEQKEKIKADLELVLLAIAKLNAAKKGSPEEGAKEIDLGMGGQTDILGFTQEQWDNFFKNIEQGTIGFQTMSMAVGAMQNLYAQFDKFLTANENAQLKKYERNSDAKKRRLKQQLDAGYINQAQYKKQIEQIDQETAKKKFELEYKQAKRQKQMAMVNAIIGTAQAIVTAANNPFPLNIVMMALAGITGALQIATIAKQPLPSPGYEKGLYPEYIKREQDGKVFKASYGGTTKSGVVSKPTHFLAGENGPEMIIDSKAYSQLSPETRNALLREIRGIKGYENGYYKDDVLHTGPENPDVSPKNQPASSDALLKMVLEVLKDNTEVMKDLRDSGVIAHVSNKDIPSMKNIKDGIDRYNEIRNKAKQG